MSTNKIYCFGDGFAHGHIWPEWPQLLEALFPTYKIILKSGVGAGPEFLVTQFAEIMPLDGHVIFQWPIPNRFDKIIEDDQWMQYVNQDSVYQFNTYECNGRIWWLSSASDTPIIREYHKKFVQVDQSNLRLKVYQTLVQEILNKSLYSYVFTSTTEQDVFSLKDPVIRGSEIQPSPLSHYYYLTEELLPKLGLQSKYTQTLKEFIIAQNWQPYDPDRAEIWNNIKEQLK